MNDGARGGVPLLEEDALAILVTPPAAGTARDVSSLPEPDLSRLPGARVVARVAYDGAGWSFGAGCARAPSDRFVPGVEGVIFEKATWFTLRGAALSPDALAVVRTGETEGVTEQTSLGRAGADGIALRHVLTFAGASSDVVVCSAVCRGPEPACAEAVASLTVSGTPAPPPAPGILARGLVWGVEHPVAALASFALATALVAAAALRFRPAEP